MSDNNKYDTMPFQLNSPSPVPVESDGGQAFPGETWGSKGMSLRDYFAARALENDIANHRHILYHSGGYIKEPTREQCRYAYADAMLAERQKERG